MQNIYITGTGFCIPEDGLTTNDEVVNSYNAYVDNFNLDNAEATTLTGQHFIKFSQQMSNLYYNKKLGTTDEDYCIYIDTDSLFYPSIPIIEHKYKDFNKNDDEFMSEKTIEVAGELQDFLNKSG